MDQEKLDESRHDLLFGVRRSVRYHSRRRQFFDRYRILTVAISVIFASTTIAAVLAELPPQYAVAAAALITIFSIIDLVVGSARMARLHEDLYRRFIQLEKSIVAVPDGELKFKDWARLTADRLGIESDEPPVKRVLDTICHNELARAMGYADEQFIRMTWYQRFFAQLFDIQGYSLSKQQ